jgi:hypothetical protein
MLLTLVPGSLLSPRQRHWAYQPLIFGREGILAAASVLVAPFVLLLVMIWLLPPWQEAAISPSSAASTR